MSDARCSMLCMETSRGLPNAEYVETQSTASSGHRKERMTMAFPRHPPENVPSCSLTAMMKDARIARCVSIQTASPEAMVGLTLFPGGTPTINLVWRLVHREIDRK